MTHRPVQPLPTGAARRQDGWRPTHLPGALAAILVLGLALRTYDLLAQSLWLDEAMSLYWASLPAGEVLARLMTLSGDPHPPLYYLMLKAWIAALGDGEAAIKSLSVAAGLAIIAFTYALGQRLFDRRAGLLAALLAAASPLLVWYAQEVRMYSLLTAFTLAATLCLWQALDTKRGRWWLLYALLALAGAYTHVYGALLLPSQGMFALWVWGRGWRGARCDQYATRLSSVVAGMSAFAAVASLYAPWALAAWQSSGSAFSGRPLLGPPEMVSALLAAFTAHRAAVPGLVLAAVAAIALLGLAAGRRESAEAPVTSTKPTPRTLSTGDARVFLCLYLLLPLGLVSALSQRYQLWGVPYFTILAPPFLVAVAAGVAALTRLRRVVGLAAAGLLLTLAVAGLAANAAPENRKEDWRAAAAYVRDHAAADDAILVVADFAAVPFRYYYRGPAAVFTPWGGRLSDPAAISAPLDGLATVNNVWLVQSHQEPIDPDGLIPRLLDQRYPTVTEQFPKGVRLTGYAVRTRLTQLPPGVVRVDQSLGPLRLVGRTVDPGPHFAVDRTYHPPSGWVHMTLYWQADLPVDLDYLVSVRLVDAVGQVWGDKLDRPSSTLRRYPTSRWAPGEIVRDEYDVNLNPATPPGAYRLEVSVLAPDGNALRRAVVDEVEISR
jgi:mannosyltransferase